MCMFYATLNHPAPATSMISEITVLFLLLCLYASLGHIVNSYCDRKIDLAAGKPNALAAVSDTGGRELVAFVLIASLVTIFLIYVDQPVVLAMFYLAIVIAVLYSMPPIRLKERGIFGLIAATIAQRTLPVAIVFHALAVWNWTALALCLLSTLIGMRYIIVHQIKDESADLLARVQTVATTRGVTFLQHLLRKVVFPLELVTLVIVLFLMSMDLQSIGIATIMYIFWAALQWVVLDKNKESRFSVESYTVLADFYYIYWPLLLCALLVERNKIFWIVFIFTLVWLFRRLRREVVQIWRVIFALRLRFSYRK